MAREIKQGYTAVVLSGAPAKDTAGFDLTGYFQYRTSLSDHKQYWLKPDDEARGRVIEIISQDLMEQDYSEVLNKHRKNDNITHNGKIAHHPNHGTSHGLRQKEHQTQYLELIKQRGTPLYQEAASNLTAEELAIMKLAAYMYRLGRTNELPFYEDPLYRPRAAQIFRQVAKELEFNPDLIELIAGTMNVFRSIAELQEQDNGQGPMLQVKGIQDVPLASARQKAILFERLIEMGHLTEWVRCYYPRRLSTARGLIAFRLKGMLSSPSQADKIVGLFLQGAAQLNKITGDSVSMLEGISVDIDVPLLVQCATEPLWTEAQLAQTAKEFMDNKGVLNRRPAADRSDDIDALLTGFERRIEFVGEYHLSAIHKARNLLITLRQEKQKAFEDPTEENLDLFLKNASTAIKKAIPILQKDLSWSDYLDNLLKQLINAITTGLAFLGTFGMSKHRGFFAVKPSLVADHAKSLNSNLNNVVGATAPA